MKYILKKATGVFAFCSAFAATSVVSLAGTIHTSNAVFTGPGTEPVQYLVTVVRICNDPYRYCKRPAADGSRYG